MVYLINRKIIFNDEEGTLAWRDREHETVALSAPVARILATLLENAGVTLSRESLLRETLEKHALSASMNNLNNYISLLRKVLREFELAEAIVTIPKTGILFTANSIEPLAQTVEESGPGSPFGTDEKPARQDDIAWTSVMLPVPQRRVEPSIWRRYSVKRILAIGLIPFCILVTLMFPSRFPYRPLVKVNVPGKCSVYSLQGAVSRAAWVGYPEQCSDNILFFITKKRATSGTLINTPGILIACSKQGKGCVTYVDY